MSLRKYQIGDDKNNYLVGFRGRNITCENDLKSIRPHGLLGTQTTKPMIERLFGDTNR